MNEIVYIVYGETYYIEYGSYIGLFGIFSSRELAEEAKAKITKELFEKNKDDPWSNVSSMNDIYVYIEEIEKDKVINIELGGYAE